MSASGSTPGSAAAPRRSKKSMTKKEKKKMRGEAKARNEYEIDLYYEYLGGPSPENATRKQKIEFIRESQRGEARKRTWFGRSIAAITLFAILFWAARVWMAVPSLDGGLKLIFSIISFAYLYLSSKLIGWLMRERRQYRNGPTFHVTPPLFSYPPMRIFVTMAFAHTVAQVTSFLDGGAVDRAIASGDANGKVGILTKGIMPFAIAALSTQVAMGGLFLFVKSNSEMWLVVLYGAYGIGMLILISFYIVRAFM